MHWLFDFIHRLQKRPVEERKRFAALVAGIITGIIFMFWLSARMNSKEEINTAQYDVTPLKTMGSIIKSAASDIKTAVGLFNDAKKEIQNPPQNE